MVDLWAAFWLSLGVVFVAELGDKSQLMALTFATRYRPLPVIVGITVAGSVVHLVSASIGAGFGELIPHRWISLLASLVFFGFAAWSLWGPANDADDDVTSRDGVASTTRSVVITVTTAFFLAELGDKTMLASITLATQNAWLGVWLGATVGMVLGSAIAIVVGHQIGSRLPPRVLRYTTAVLFAAVGMWLLVDSLPGLL